jgi:hypothetical protein
MNTYLGRSEKELFTRLDALLGTAMEIKEKYEKTKGPDKEFMKALRMGITWLDKALIRRMLMLEPDAREDLKRNASHMKLLLVPNDKAKFEFDQMRKMNSVLHVKVDDFEDWYEGVIPNTCGRCKIKDYAKCKQRKFLREYGIYPVNLKAKGTCEYNYLDAGIDLDKMVQEAYDKKLSKEELAEVLQQKFNEVN